MLELALVLVGWIIGKFGLEAKIINGVVKGAIVIYDLIKGWIKK